MPASKKHKWTFSARFRRNAFGWRSQPAIIRVREAVSEIKKAARKNPILGAEGAVKFLEKVSPALTHVDSSSGAIGAAVNKAVRELVSVISLAPADDAIRGKWLERLWHAVEEDQIPYIEVLPEYWGELCVAAEIASKWADEFMGIVRIVWGPDKEHQGYYIGIPACLSTLYKAKRYDEILELLELAPHKFWSERKWGVKAFLAKNRSAKALRFAEDSHGLNENPFFIAEACEEILLSSGMAEEAYNRYAVAANQKTTYLATFRAILRKYPKKEPAEILKDLVASTSGQEGKWFAAAKFAGLYEEAVRLANQTPCDPRTLTRASRDNEERRPGFAVEAGITALRWMLEGYGYEIFGIDVISALNHTLTAAAKLHSRAETIERIRKLIKNYAAGNELVRKIIEKELEQEL